jgi:phage terminase large subunit GpA-like protein
VNLSVALDTNDRAEMLRMVEDFRPQKLRTMREFAEQEIIIPEGQYAGLPFRLHRQPWAKVWFDEIESGRWTQFCNIGSRQGGKTFLGSTIPLLYHIFEMRETAIFAAPLDEQIADKWKLILKPAILSSKYRDLIPTRGSGARGGSSNLNAIEFLNGVTMKFMTGGGTDKSRASFTSRVLIVTEVDGFDVIGGTSAESTKLAQMEGCTASYDNRARRFYECTASIETGKIWTSYTKGSCSLLYSPCPKCECYVNLERGNLIGWQDAKNVIEAGQKARYRCPKCNGDWAEDERRDSMQQMKIVHRGQKILDNGEVTGDPPETETLGFRWTVAQNLFVTASTVGKEEFTAMREARGDEGELKMRQFWWALPAAPEADDMHQLTIEGIASRLFAARQGETVESVKYVTVGVDVQKKYLYWTAIAWRDSGGGYILDYGIDPVDSDHLAEEEAISQSLTTLRSRFEDGWLCPTDGEYHQPNYVFIDCGNWMQVICDFAKSCENIRRGVYQAVRGCGTGGDFTKKYTTPPKAKKRQLYIGQCMHQVEYDAKRTVVEIDADYWKSWLFARLASPPDAASALLLYTPERGKGHFTFGRHLTAEKREAKYVEGKGVHVSWNRVSKHNHWLDASYYAAAASWPAGVRLAGEPKDPSPKEGPEPEQPKATEKITATRPDGRSWYDIGRRSVK